MKILNYTPHTINIVNPDHTEFRADIRKNVALSDYEIIATVESSGVLSAKIQTAPGPNVGGIPIFEKQIIGVDPLPETDDPDTIFIVSALYVSAYRKVHGDDARLYTIADPVYSQDGKTIIGSLGICPAF